MGKRHVPKVECHGPVAVHDQACAVIWAEPAVLDMNTSVFHPSWAAQSEGWRLVLARSWIQRLAIRLLFDKPTI